MSPAKTNRGATRVWNGDVFAAAPETSLAAPASRFFEEINRKLQEKRKFRVRTLPRSLPACIFFGGLMQSSLPQQTNIEFLGGRVSVTVGDITRETREAIVNAANSTLTGGGGVDGAIHRAGGPRILEECLEIRRTRYRDGLPTGEAVITTAGLLPARHVIHTVGPVYGHAGGREAELLAACYRNSLALAASRGLASVAFPSISTGAFGYPREEAAAVASRAVAEFLKGDARVGEVGLVFFSVGDMNIFLRNHKFES
jgi:O-acetyl-ADP-ribose deacetylase